MKVLIVEDNPALSDSISKNLSMEGFTCTCAYTSQEASDLLISALYDMVLLDIMLPDGTGLDVLKYMQDLDPMPGCIIISAKDALDDRLEGLDLGADDYLTKPFHFPELLARIKAIYRRKGMGNSGPLTINEISIYPASFEVYVNQKQLNLTRKEFELLMYFVSNKNRVVSKQAIAEYLWGAQVDLYDSFDFVYQHIKNLRKKITQAGGNDYITTVYGFGYKFYLKAS
ncbi:MAG: response regulator transcription factor [Bacteroidota bacterium]